MRIVNHDGRLGLLTSAGVVDVETASRGRFSSDPQSAYAQWDEFRAWADGGHVGQAEHFEPSRCGAPAPRPSQVFAIGLNYADHAEEAQADTSQDSMVVFTKFPSSIAGADTVVEVAPDSVDFEAELIVVIGRTASKVPASDGWAHVAGLTVGQDISDRVMQFRDPTPQFSLSKSRPGFSPMGPILVTPDEFANVEDLEISCRLNGESMQRSRTKFMIFPIPEIIARLSSSLTLFPGDVIFTGTPGGVGWARDPRISLADGDELVTSIEGIGSIRTRFVAGPRDARVRVEPGTETPSSTKMENQRV